MMMARQRAAVTADELGQAGHFARAAIASIGAAFFDNVVAAVSSRFGHDRMARDSC